MLRSNFFYTFFKQRRRSEHGIVKYNSNKRFDLQDQMYHEIREIDQKISENSKALIEAQIVKLRSNLSKSNHLIKQIGQNIYKVKLEDSINWHQKQLKELYSRRKELQINLEKVKGIFWLNRIKRFLILVCFGFFLLLGLLIFLSGFMIIIYLLPMILFILLGYLILNKKY